MARTELRVELPATLNAIELFCGQFHLWRAMFCPGVECFPAELLLREALTNAIVHGCAEDPSERITCVLRAKPGRLLITVRDAGQGFDWRGVGDGFRGVSCTDGRGVEILRKYASAVRFNTSGNSVTLIKRF
jgi:anti-sigma regulatory factor (Ser/Thr protein kinase)